MQTIDYIRKAEHCLNTGQPNLAVLYMGRARQANHEERQLILKQRQMLLAIKYARPILKDWLRAVEAVGPQIVAAMKAAGEAAEQAAQAMAGFAKAVERAQARNNSVIRRQDHMKGPRP